MRASIAAPSPPDHPREYGENTATTLRPESPVGSSPRIRGESVEQRVQPHCWGIIPANTGRISRNSKHHGPAQDHPREYGENFHRARSRKPLMGSSPRIRGELVVFNEPCGACGIIPANTGRIRQCPVRRENHRDHPREYGENVVAVTDDDGDTGSSPRIRGESLPLPRRTHARGIIPANTGRIRFAVSPKVRPQDHPREYGENPGQRKSPTLSRGSSPRIRGEFWLPESWWRMCGIIPANTGRIGHIVRV